MSQETGKILQDHVWTRLCQFFGEVEQNFPRIFCELVLNDHATIRNVSKGICADKVFSKIFGTSLQTLW